MNGQVIEKDIKWNEGLPPFPWNDEWFIAKLYDGSIIELYPLPKDFTYDWHDKEDTFYTDEKIKGIVVEWAQKSNSAYVEFSKKQ
jgi:hypothetical protein